MEKHEEENGLCKAESVDGSLDVWSCQNSDSSSADHLVVMVHGILGSTDDWKFGAEQFVKKMPDKVFVHCSEKNVSALTLDGVDVMGERLAAEVLDIIQRKPNICKISFVAHSLGGLAARYAIGKLYKPANQEDVKDSVADSSQETPKGTICGLEAMNFITVATPHLGSMGNKQVPFLFGFSSIEKVAGLIIHWIFKRTGRHLFLKDEEEGKPPLLRRMVEDTDDCHFISALRAFKRRVAYSNVGHDHVVGWKTASIRRDSELPKWEDSLNEKYPHIVYEELCKACDMEDIPEGENHSDDIEEEMIKGLSSVSWEKVDVSFHSSRQRFAAHSVIQVKNEDMHIEGADVIEHIIDHFHA
ncbi:putative alpha/Beta hydrolase [Arabidopsis thaliana]|jgi:hypothetical protein|uniref:AT5G51180 protein n=4 Tax=Arabidopsis TaxID=3701 RepID=Q949V0_ARATH|nr:alpha/beta-Hydrolases superfamily protein [Arabidopsis thaliana]NP_851167.1 alpha/beta-Hydrolases superfamily protein [Arabidopsis thaliana]KAG7605667.1 hypothetical protein ISN45_At05g046610 [Arabidopsis thaliana x Arabidopsis arenosa]KAG7612591.1 hypothetical protein ISN44_As05g045970 [Arabidopsis suecica]AAK92812.1 unknown protein [Arabidopsis thaliana]AAM14150.1 unknown protein [Arabidopsis thaliana]AED96048.1 alpha/beta-Hydrolases superfamily protein [Arabidopsis thaliana]|eukprot:NP_568754.1 alpha/beta-Hydrolases superfamily protein [Arabidopsis thaliana]